jgi:hypothetical protein
MSLQVYIGYDERQPLAFNVLQHSIRVNASEPIAITGLHLDQLPIKRRGMTAFTFSRFLVPYLCNFRGKALFLDADMVVTGDIAELFKSTNWSSSALVNKQQDKFEWASAILFNCDNCKSLTPAFIDNEKNQLFDFAWAEHGVGEFPAEWNMAVGYCDTSDAKLLHYTQGIPCWAETRGVDDGPWVAAFKDMVRTCSWKELLGNSVHAKHVYERLKKRA